VAEAIRERSRSGKPFSIVAVAEGAISRAESLAIKAAEEKKAKSKSSAKKTRGEEQESNDIQYADRTLRLAQKLEQLTGLEARVTILGHLQRGGIPSAADRLLATRLGTACADLINKGTYGVMVAARGDDTKAIKLEDVAGKIKTVPPDHPWVESARRVGANLGD
jgi:ATP-dependent phosphofructokinase / diphosphate-dependent phosphofructokinase